MKRKDRKTASPLAILAALALIPAFGAQFARGANPPLSSEQTSAIQAISKLAAETPDRLDSVLERIGFPAGSAPQGWNGFPVVRKIEYAYASANKAGTGGGNQLLALLAQDLKGRFESVAYEPALKPLLSVPAKPPLAFHSGDLPPPVALDPAKRQIIATISKYSEGGALGGPHGILEHYFNLPSVTTYEILRKARTPEEALVMGLAFVQERERASALERVVTRIDQVYGETAVIEKSLDPFRPQTRKAGPVITELSTQPKPDLGRDDNRGGFPGAPGTGSGGRPEPPRPPSTASERYVRFVETNYPVESGRMFTSMVEIAEGFGGVVLGNKVTSPALPRPTQLIWMQHDKTAQGSTGEIRIRFADGSERFYGPVDAEDAYAAALMVTGGNGLAPWVKGEGVGLVSLNQRDERPHFTSDNRVAWEGRWDITLHPALSRLRLGRSVLMCDATPIHREAFLDMVESSRGAHGAARQADALADVFKEDISNWKFTDAPLQITASGNRIQVVRAYDPAHPLSLDYRRRTFLTMQGFEDGEKASKGFSAAFDPFMPDLILSSQHYQRLNDFVAVFAIYRWAYSQKALLLNRPAEPSGLDPVPPSLILSGEGQFELADYSTEADVLRDFYREGDQRFDTIAANFPQALRAVATQTAGSRRQIQDQQIRLAELEEQLENVRLDFRALSLRLEERLPAANRDEQSDKLLELEDRVESEIRESSHGRSVASEGASARLSEFAAKIDPAIGKQLSPVLDQYSSVSAQLRAAEQSADEAQMNLHQQVLKALTGGASDYDRQYEGLKKAYGDSISALVKALQNESEERGRWEKDPARTGSELVAALIGTELMESTRRELLGSDSDADRKDLARIEALVEKDIAGSQSGAYGQSIRAANAAFGKSADARMAFANLLDRRDTDLTKQYPDWRTWWALITCSRHPSTVHLDFDTAVRE